jgi:hypothetical protein
VTSTTDAPPIAPWQLALRFALEVTSLIVWGLFAHTWAPGTPGIVLAWSVPAALAILWGTFAVKGDPSRSGNAPVPIPGVLRLGFELVVFFGAAAVLAARGNRFAIALVAGGLLHHAMTVSRIRWLVRQ